MVVAWWVPNGRLGPCSIEVGSVSKYANTGVGKRMLVCHLDGPLDGELDGYYDTPLLYRMTYRAWLQRFSSSLLFVCR